MAAGPGEKPTLFLKKNNFFSSNKDHNPISIVWKKKSNLIGKQQFAFMLIASYNDNHHL